ncbi:putative ferric reductase protein [Lasiodiplodia theobromae]|nr:putative ferric reductase protein [Lasiodiplodia theobromae]
MPLLIALGGKVNIVTLLTGICYTKLNILHRYVGGVIFALATIHTVPHIYAPIKDGGFDYLAQLYIDQKRELSGTILYFLFLCMIALSIPWFRRKFYETFVYTHIFLGLSFIGILAWHIKGEYMAPVYMYVTLGILLLQTMFRLLLSTRSLLFLSGYPTTLEPLPGAVTKVRVAVPAALRWHPGDHAFIRMPSLSVLDNHPFTIASVPSPPNTATNTLTFLIRTHAGFTSRLAALAAAKAAGTPSSSLPASLYRSSLSSLEEAAAHQPSHHHQPPPQGPPLRTLIDGPHSRGARVPALHATVDTVVLVAAGTGVTAAVPWLLDLGRRMAADAEAGANDCRVGAVRLVWVVRRAECVEWIREEVGEVLAMVEEAGAGRGRVVVDVYVTGGSGSSSGSEAEVGEKKKEEEENGGAGGGVLVAGSGGERGGDGDVMPAPPPPAYGGVAGRGDEEGRLSAETEGLGTVEVEEQGGFVVHHERPVIASLLPSLVSGTRAFVLGCGPEGFKVELSNAVAKMQREMVLKSRSMESIALHTETFGW